MGKKTQCSLRMLGCTKVEKRKRRSGKRGNWVVHSVSPSLDLSYSVMTC